MNEFYDILVELGYELRDSGKEFRAKPIYRESDNVTSLSIDKQTGKWRDYSANLSGSFEELVQLSLGNVDINQVSTWLSQRNRVLPTAVQRPKIVMPRTFSLDHLAALTPDHSYWKQRGINTQILTQFQGGVAGKGRMLNRYVFPIFDMSKKSIVGFTGRDLTGRALAKWKHIGVKSNWLYPLFLNFEELKTKRQVILVESIGDMLALWNQGITNVIVLFGVSLSIPVLNILLKLDPRKIIIATNFDEGPGVTAARTIDRTLQRHFDSYQIATRLPAKKDFGEMNAEEIKLWYQKI